MLLLTCAKWESCFSRMSVPHRAQWSKKVRAQQHMTVPMARGHGLKKGLDITLPTYYQTNFRFNINQTSEAEGIADHVRLLRLFFLPFDFLHFSYLLSFFLSQWYCSW